MSETRTVWVAYTNSDNTEGRGHDIPIAVCATEVTARRLARRCYVQGSDGPVRQMQLVKLEGKWYAPSAAINVIEPSPEDVVAQKKFDAKQAALEKAKQAGLTDDELQLLGYRKGT